MLRFWRTTPLDLGRDLNWSELGGESSADPSVITGLWASSSDNGEENGMGSDSEREEPRGSAQPVGSGGYESYWPMARRAISGMVGKAKGEPSRVGHIVCNGAGEWGKREGYDERKARDDHVFRISIGLLASVQVWKRDQKWKLIIQRQVPGGRLPNAFLGFDLLTATITNDRTRAVCRRRFIF